MPILNSIGALSLEEGGDNGGPVTINTGSFTKIVSNYDGSVFIILHTDNGSPSTVAGKNTSVKVYERDSSTGNYAITFTAAVKLGLVGSATSGSTVNDVDINGDGDKFVYSTITSPAGGGTVYAYQKVGGIWTLKNTVYAAGNFGRSLSLSDSGSCAITSDVSLDISPKDGSLYVYGDICKYSIFTILPRYSAINPATTTWPRNVLISNSGNYVKVSSTSGIIDTYSTTTKAYSVIPSNAVFHSMSCKANTYQRPFLDLMLSGNKNVSFEIPVAMNFVTITWGLVTSPTILPVATITIPTYSYSWDTDTVANVVVATSTLSNSTDTPVYFISPDLPAGLSFNLATARITGTPTTVQAPTVYTVTADYDVVKASGNISIGVVLAHRITAINSSYSFIVNKAITLTNTVTVSGFVGTVTYTISGPNGARLPAGLVFNPSTGAISGTPTVYSASTVYTVTATDSITSKSATFSLSVAYPVLIVNQLVFSAKYYIGEIAPAINIVSVPSGTNLNSIPYSISPANNLPSGLQFDRFTGLFKGNPTTVVSPTVYQITVTDIYLQTVTKNITVETDYRWITTKSFNLGNVNKVTLITKNIGDKVTVESTYSSYSYLPSPQISTGKFIITYTSDSNKTIIFNTYNYGSTTQWSIYMYGAAFRGPYIR